jgi:hypothetical protein
MPTTRREQQDLDAVRTELSESLDLFRAIIDQGALKHVAHLADSGDLLRTMCHERINAISDLLRGFHGDWQCPRCGTVIGPMRERVAHISWCRRRDGAL